MIVFLKDNISIIGNVMNVLIFINSLFVLSTAQGKKDSHPHIPLSYLIMFPEILRAPENATVFLDQSAEFTCETDGGLSGWRMNGTLLEDLPPEIHSDLSVSVTNTAEGSRVEVLTIPARAEYNGTRVQCLVLGFGSFVESENATLKIQGTVCCKTIQSECD